MLHCVQPIGQCDQITSECVEWTDRIDVAIRRNSNKYLFGTDIDPSRIGVHDRQHPSTLSWLALFLVIVGSFCWNLRPEVT